MSYTTNIYPMPEQASSWAADVDWINSWITDVSLICTFGIVAVMVWFAFRYRRSAHAKPTSKTNHNVALETVWTAVPL